MIPIIGEVREWECLSPSCDFTQTTKGPVTGQIMHNCAGTGGMSVPLVPKGTKGELRVVEREDYVGTESVQRNDEGRPIMSVVTIRDDGQDCTVYAPTATGRGN